MVISQVAKGIWKISYGITEEQTPCKNRRNEYDTNKISEILISKSSRESIFEEIELIKNKRGITVKLPMQTGEDIYGFGLQFMAFNHAGKRRFIKVNSDPVADTGESHAPIPFYISTAGYGIFVDTYRYTTFYMGTNTEKGQSQNCTIENQVHEEFSESALYALKSANEKRKIIIDVPVSEGIDLYLFEGNIKEVVQRYVQFSGGGCLPPMWGLGNWYRVYGGSNEQEVLKMASKFRKEHIPISVLGIEPGWHSHSYSCSYKWSYLFPDADRMISELTDSNYKVNLWEHCFIYPTAPFYTEVLDYAADYEVWKGLVPDFTIDRARQIFGSYHKEKFIEKNISGFKLDECDNSDYNPSNWSYPDSTQFPGGMDGEQMHQAIGGLYESIFYDIYRESNIRTLSQIRTQSSLCTNMPFVLYSDLYNHKQFITALVNSGFSGILWCPEVRDCLNGDDLLRRLETVVFSHQCMINAWRIPNPPWKQTDIESNLQNIEMETADYYTTKCRELLELRMSLLPYIYSAYAEYEIAGVPPIRPLVMDYEDDANVRNIDDEYMFGSCMLVAPLTYEEQMYKRIYLPKGIWYEMSTGDKYEGSQYYDLKVPYDRIPVFIKNNSIIPFARSVEYVDNDTVFDIIIDIYGDEGEFVLYEDDFNTFEYKKNLKRISIEFKDGRLNIDGKPLKYRIGALKF